MNVKRIDVLLHILEMEADSIGLQIDKNPSYLAVCEIVTKFEAEPEKVQFHEKTFVRDALREYLFPVVKLDYDRISATLPIV